ncbi:uncharacterized protein LOC144162115 isoform X1 [Haemaphysalis longicornis]
MTHKARISALLVYPRVNCVRSVRSSSSRELCCPRCAATTCARNSRHTLNKDHNGSCPSADELSVDRYMKTWNDKVETHLRAFRGVLKTESASWNTLTRDLHFFTAHLDEQRGSSVRIVSYLACKPPVSTCDKRLPRLNCTFKTAQGVRGTVAAEVQFLVGDSETPFSTAQVMCPLPKGWNDVDLAVTVREASNLKNTPKFWINVTQAPKISKAKCCAVCVKPVYQSDLTPLKVAEFIGHYRVIGARHFFLYDQDMSEGLKALLARFQSVGIDVAVVPFKLRFNGTLVPYWGQAAALHDCIWRSVAKAEWFVHVDFDELIVPLRLPSLPAIVNDTERQAGRPRVGSVRFLSRSYCYEYGASKSSMDNGELPLYSRLYSFFAPSNSDRFTPKYMARARSVDIAAIHSVLLHSRGTVARVMPGKQGAVNHYRRCCPWRKWNFKRDYGVDLWNASALLRDNATNEFTDLVEKELSVTVLKDIVKDNAHS